jgi:hypothetical protein
MGSQDGLSSVELVTYVYFLMGHWDITLAHIEGKH